MEDEFNLADAIANRLKMEKYSVDIAVNGDEGLFNALSGIYDLIILDVKLPKKNGFEILREIKKDNIEIMKKELMLLEYFMRNPNIVISKDVLYDKIWGFDNNIESNSIEAYISFVRKKFKAIGLEINIKAIRGLGYKLEV